MDLILQPFIRNFKILASHGLPCKYEQTYHVALKAFLADDLANHMLGFKESFSFVYTSNLYGYT